MRAGRHIALSSKWGVALTALALQFSLFAFFFSPISLRAQMVSLSLNSGCMMPNDVRYSRFSTVSFGGAVSVAWKPAGNTYWQHYWRWPAFGVRGSYAHIVGSPAGDRIGLNGFVSAPLWKRMEWILGLGVSAYTKPYSLTGDTNNVFIGSVLNCLIDVGVAYRLDSHLSLALHLLHSSNGMLERPNQGLNFVQLDFSCALPSHATLQQTDDTLPVPHFSHCEEWGLSLAPGLVMSRDPRRQGYFGCYDVGIHYQRYVKPLVAFGGTLDLWYNSADRWELLLHDNPYRLPLYLSAMASMELFCGPLSLRLGAGTLVLGSSQISIPYYERVALFYNVGCHYAGVSLHAHGGRVEFIEWTYGVRFRREDR